MTMSAVIKASKILLNPEAAAWALRSIDEYHS